MHLVTSVRPFVCLCVLSCPNCLTCDFENKGHRSNGSDRRAHTNNPDSERVWGPRGICLGKPMKPTQIPPWDLHGICYLPNLTTGQQWAGPGGAQVGYEWASPSPYKSHRPTVAHGNPGRDLDGLAMWETDKQTDRRMLPSALSSCYAVDN